MTTQPQIPVTLIEKLEHLKNPVPRCEWNRPHNIAVDACIAIVRQHLADPAVVELVAIGIYDKWQSDMSDEYTEEWEYYASKEWFLAMAKAALAAVLGEKE